MASKQRQCVLFVLVVFGFLLSLALAGSLTTEQLLQQHGRPLPSENLSKPIQVNISYSMVQILYFDQEKQQIHLIGRTALEWYDLTRTWNKQNFGNLPSIVLSPETVWTPDIILYNLVEPPMVIYDSWVRLFDNGKVTWQQHSRYTMNCKTQPNELTPTCDLKFGSFAHDNTLLRLRSSTDRLDTSFYYKHDIWELYKNKVMHGTHRNPFVPFTDFDDVTFEFQLRRWLQEETDDTDESGAASMNVSMALAVASVMVAMLFELR